MNLFLEAIATGITSFAATNIDDMVILILFFSRLNDNFRPQHIITGQYLGFTVLIIASLPGFFGGLIIPKIWLGLLGLLPIAIGIKHLMNRKDDTGSVQGVSAPSLNNKSLGFSLASILSVETYNVATVTVANGGDNIGIYLPLFASSNLIRLAVIIAVFYLLIPVWSYVAYLFTLHPILAKLLTRYGQAFSPFLLIGLGIYILINSGTYHLLIR